MDVNNDERVVVLDTTQYLNLLALAKNGIKSYDRYDDERKLDSAQRHVCRFNPHVVNEAANRQIAAMQEKHEAANYLRRVVRNGSSDVVYYVKGMWYDRKFYVPVKIIGRAKRGDRNPEKMIAVEPYGVTPKLLYALDCAFNPYAVAEGGIPLVHEKIYVYFAKSRRQEDIETISRRRPIFKVFPRNLLETLPADAVPAPEAHHGTLEYLAGGCYFSK